MDPLKSLNTDIRSVTELITLRAREQPNDPAVYTGIPEPDNSIRIRSLSYIDMLRAVDRLAWHYASAGLGIRLLRPLKTVPPPQTVAVLAPSSIDVMLLEFALGKLGLSPLLLSIANSVVATTHLIKVTKATHLIYDSDFLEHAKEVEETLRCEGYKIRLVEDRRFPLWGDHGVASTKDIRPFEPYLTPEQEAERASVILHSSGSTGLPKPVYFFHCNVTANVVQEKNYSGYTMLPLHHAFGHFAVILCIRVGTPITISPPHLPSTAANLCAAFAASPPATYCFAVPYILKLLAETEEGMKMLQTFQVVGVSGAPTPDYLGDQLVEAGVNLLSSYGASETATLMESNRDFSSDKGWSWLRCKPITKPLMFFEPRGEDTFELVLRGYPSRFAYNLPKDSYATKDLFQRHPEDEDRWRYIGRIDDILVHISGKKTNPVTMELTIRGDSHVSEAIVFGAGRPQTGVLILPSEAAKDLSKEELMERVWPVIGLANAEAPSYSRILPEMVEFLPYGTQIPSAAKMSFIRPACYLKFRDLIDNVYTRFEEGSDVVERISLDSLDEMECYIAQTVERTSGQGKEPPTKDEDLLSFGVDSLQATRIRNTIQKEVNLGEGVLLRQTIVFEYPSVKRLATYLMSLRTQDKVEEGPSPHEKMFKMLEKHFSNVEPRTFAMTMNGDPKPMSARTILLTGATGSLGAHILHTLLASPSVRKVICISRAASHLESRERVQESLKLRKLPIPAGDRWISYAGNSNERHLGLSEAQYESIRKEATDVIHNAWPVNFVLNIDSFDSHISGAVNLMNLCQNSPYKEPASFYFSSSVSSRVHTSDGLCEEDFPSNSNTAAGMGYAQSKWVVEKLCERAAREKGLMVGVLRIGQIVGDTIHGVWNESEALSMLFKSADLIGALPSFDENLQWLPSDYAARGISEIVLGPQRKASAVYHIVNSDTTATWNDILQGLELAGMKFKRVTTEKWLEKLSNSDPDPMRNPTIKLLDFFRHRWGVYAAGQTRPAVFSTVETSKVSPGIRDSPPLTDELVGKWVASWRETGFLR
ncbi:hypothetical protein V5O48_005042 [Marasmius crinis-equi]|uniref:Carrier domain-containing protein n=1 Tax=Marasmius crinis-equi TaxID=585013 RepID=A0ABR3FNV1_9AGAR